MIGRLADLLGEWLFPSGCPGCRRGGHDGFCPACLASIASFQPSRVGDLDVVCCGLYEGPLRRAILDLKSSGRTEVARPLGRWMASSLRQAHPSLRVDLVVAAPAAPSRLRFRGYHPAGLLARVAAGALEVALEPACLECLREPREQKGLSREERRHNVKGAFEARRPLDGRSVLLVDDVVTTGETVLECARVLRQAGASQVLVLAAARSASPGDA